MRSARFAVGFLLTLACAVSSSAVRVKTVEPGTRTYGATDAILGALGTKRKVSKRFASDVVFFDRQTVPEWASLQIYNAGSVLRDETYIAELKKLGISAPALNALNASATMTSKRHKEYRVVVLQIKDNLAVAKELMRLAARDSALNAMLRTPGMRLVTSVEAVFGHQATSQFAVGGDAALSNLGGTSIQIELGVNRSSTVKLSDGMIVAYQFACLCWNTEGTVLQLHRDIDGGRTCPKGMAPVLSTPASAKETSDSCPSLQGHWRRDIDNVPLTFVQSECGFTAAAPDKDISHRFVGIFSNGRFQYKIFRRNELVACETVMSGYVDVVDNDHIVMNIVGTDGNCELPAGFQERFAWHRDASR
jgi:hypothetical protein